MNSIYTVTTFNVVEDGKILTDRYRNSRTWGWFPTKEWAEADLLSDQADLYFESGTYQLAVIEEVPPGLMGSLHSTNSWWYVVESHGDGSYSVVGCSPPTFARNSGGFSMG